MCDIYRNSIFTIAASCSASDCAGFLGERTIDDPIKLNTPGLQSVRFRKTVDHSRMLREDPIHGRAWTFQEAILPRRLLSFGSCEAIWECETHRQCECRQIEYEEDDQPTPNELGRAAYRKYTRGVIEGKFHAGERHGLPRLGALSTRQEIYTRYALTEKEQQLVDDRAFCDRRKRVQRMKRRRVISTSEVSSTDLRALALYEPHHIESGELSKQVAPASTKFPGNSSFEAQALNSFYRYWRRVLVPEYTRRALSKDSDRLIALQAVASDIHSGIHDRYLAGLWEGDLINQLCWQSADGQCLPADNQSPSWSWSSIRGPVVPCLPESSMPVSSGPFLADMVIKSAQCSPAGRDPCGRVLGGSITLETSAIEVRCLRRNETGLLEFRVHDTRLGHPEHPPPAPLTLAFNPDTPLSGQPDGSLARSTEKNHLHTRHHEHPMRAVLLFVKAFEGLGCCMLACSRVPAESNTCRRVGVGFVRWRDMNESHPLSRYAVVQQFVLI